MERVYTSVFDEYIQVQHSHFYYVATLGTAWYSVAALGTTVPSSESYTKWSRIRISIAVHI